MTTLRDLPAITHNVTGLPVPSRPEYSVVIRRFNTWADGRPVNEETVREFFAAQIKAGYSAASLALYKIAVKAAVYAAFPAHDVRVRASMDALFRSIRIPRPDLKVKPSDLFSREEIRKIIKKAPPHAGLLIEALYNSGARISEVLSIKLDRCREDQGDMRCRITGKGGRERDLIIGVKLFKRIKARLCGRTWLFETSWSSGTPYSRKTMYKHLKEAARKAVNRHLHPHALRHSRITHLLEEKEPMDAVSRFAGHARIETTLKCYGHSTVSAETIRRTNL